MRPTFDLPRGARQRRRQAAASLPVAPTDHSNGAIMNKHSDQFLLDIISKGGGTVEKSNFMPSWGPMLNEIAGPRHVVFIPTLALLHADPNSELLLKKKFRFLLFPP